MTIEYIWKINTCKHEVATGGIKEAHWDCVASDGDFRSRIYGVEYLNPNPENPNFINYENVTEEQVLNWVWDSVDKAEIEHTLLQRINDLKTPAIKAGLPWA